MNLGVRAVHATRAGCCVILGAAVLLPGCGGSSSSSSSSTARAMTATVTLAPVPAGTVTVGRASSSGRLTLTFDAFGLAPRSSHGVAVRTGSCAAPGQDSVATFPDLVADGGGVAQGELPANERRSDLPGGSHAEIALAPAGTSGSPSGAALIGCADLPASAAGAPAKLTAPAPPAPSGTVNLTYSGSQIQAHIIGNGLPKSSTHSVHVHFGSCAQESGVLYNLRDVTADGQGHVDTTVTLSGVNTPPPPRAWYVDVHMGAASQLTSGGQPTPLFQPILCGDGSF